MNSNTMEPGKDYYAPMHTAEHILNATMVKKFGCKRSFSNHIEKKKSKCDYYFHRNLLPEELQLIETEINHVIQKSIPVTESFLESADAQNYYDLDKIPGEIPNKIRIIHVGSYDSCPCIGAHVNNTSQIGLVKLTTSSFSEGVLRIRYKLSD